MYNDCGFGMEGSARRVLSRLLAGLLLCLLLQIEPAVADSHTSQATSCVYDHTALRSAPGRCRPHALSYPPNVRGKVRRAIYDSALIFGVPYTVLLRLALCESGLNPSARNGRHYGLFQFLPATFRRGARLMRRETGITAHNFWKPEDASYVAGYMYAIGHAPEWTCLGNGFASP